MTWQQWPGWYRHYASQQDHVISPHSQPWPHHPKWNFSRQPTQWAGKGKGKGGAGTNRSGKGWFCGACGFHHNNSKLITCGSLSNYLTQHHPSPTHHQHCSSLPSARACTAYLTSKQSFLPNTRAKASHSCECPPHLPSSSRSISSSFSRCF